MEQRKLIHSEYTRDGYARACRKAFAIDNEVPCCVFCPKGTQGSHSRAKVLQGSYNASNMIATIFACDACCQKHGVGELFDECVVIFAPNRKGETDVFEMDSVFEFDG